MPRAKDWTASFGMEDKKEDYKEKGMTLFMCKLALLLIVT